jgi:SAM-dependent methyltransferase
MPSPAVLRTLLREILTSRRIPRTPEPDLVMDDPDQVAAYVLAGRPEGVMAPVYLFNCAHACTILKPGDTVVDLACGPANQLAMVAEMNPDCRFVGIDLSPTMLERAAAHVASRSLRNVELRHGDISDLRDFHDESIDAAISTMALHHLPSVELLARTFREIARILRPDGGVYLVDFGRLKSPASIEYFASQYSDRQPELFTLDYRNSLHAAFSRSDFERACVPLRTRARVYSTFLAPYMVAVKSPPRHGEHAALRQQLRARTRALPEHHRRDLADLQAFFGAGGLRTPVLG